MKTLKRLALATIIVLVCIYANLAQAQLLRRATAVRTPVYSVTTPEKSLFNGEDLTGWITVLGSTDITGWEVEDGMIHLEYRSGDIVTDREYTNFILDFDWKISPGGNSGVKYKFCNFDGSWLGCEYQILDDLGTREGSSEKHRTADLYDIIPSKPGKPLNPVDEFNHSRIVVNGRRIQHWLNGMLVVDVCVGSPTWEKAFAESKFREHPCFGKVSGGKILLQDHGGEVWFKNITIREIETVKSVPVQHPRLLRLKFRG